MDAFRLRFVIIFVALAVFVTGAAAKRVRPKPVSPVISGGIRYSADGDGRDQYVAATDAVYGNELWEVKIFHTTTKFWVEEDNQWVFITNLKLAGNSFHYRMKSRGVTRLTLPEVCKEAAMWSDVFRIITPSYSSLDKWSSHQVPTASRRRYSLNLSGIYCRWNRCTLSVCQPKNSASRRS